MTPEERAAYRKGIQHAAEFAASHLQYIFLGNRPLRFDDVILYKFNIRKRPPRSGIKQARRRP